ncbi:MAG: T9SS-dependent M36 family metallopeptidase [Bacteroidota bacterium]
MKENSMFRLSVLSFMMLIVLTLNAQDTQPIVQGYLNNNKDKWELSRADVSDWVISDQNTDKESGITHVYLHQQSSGIRIFNAVSVAALRHNKVFSFSNRFCSNVSAKVNTRKPVISAQQSIIAAARHLGLSAKQTPVLQSRDKVKHVWIFSAPDIAQKPLKVELVYQKVGNKLRLAYDVSFAVIASSDWWNIRIDAVSGDFLEKNNWTTHCSFPLPGDNGIAFTGENTHSADNSASMQPSFLPQSPAAVESYRVFPFPLEAPTFGSRQLLTNPADALASPYGWLDTNGVAGPEYTITRGNNVFAYTDTLANDIPQYSPNAGASLSFDFPLNMSQSPSVNKAANVTNLFYLNNRVHDVLFHHGFNAAAGNFQANNYNEGGLGQDYVLAEAQDGAGTNNANFGTPPDGQSGRMQMYLWSSTANAGFTVNSPASIAGSYTGSGMSSFGTVNSTPITSNVILVNDNTSPASDACDPILNAAAIIGKIALIDRGSCTFVAKVQAAEAVGAIAVIIINNIAGAPFTMGGTGTSTIPSFMISLADGNTIKNILNSGGSVNVTIPVVAPPVAIDGSLDNGIVSHEYGHGLSTRLSGGPSNSNCLFNAENGSEGWSDWLALIMTIEPGDAGTNSRPVGTFALDEPVTGPGIRNYPYCTNMAVNPHTYADLAISGEIHDVGEIWASVLWDITWKLIDAQGFTSDWINGAGGNIIAMNLVLEGMKLQPCGPGFLDSRDAILMADSVLYGGSHCCLIWKAFAGRGMGANASQGDPNVTGDETENFDMPSYCQIPTSLPIANFTVNTTSNCSGTFAFTDLSDSIPQSWHWDFGDGSPASSIKSPSHTYATQGTYTVTLIVTNTLGADTATTTVTYATVLTPLVSGDTLVCSGMSANLSAFVSVSNLIDWMIGSNIVHSGSTYVTPPLSNTTTYSVIEHEPFITGYVGPVDNNFGTGGNHATTFEGKEKFTTYAPMRLISVDVIATGAGLRSFNLYDQGGNTLLHADTINLLNGNSTVTLNLEIPVPGTYCIGVTAPANLYRNNAGATYPYSLNGLLSITSSNATGTPLDFYYYLYNWQVEQIHCESVAATHTVTVVPAATPDFSYSFNNLSCNFIDLTSGAPQSWHWDFGDGNISIQQNPLHTYAQSGVYTIQLTVTQGNCTETVTKTMSVYLGINELNNTSLVTLAPIPARDQVMVSFGHPLAGLITVDILGLDGQKLRSYRFENASDHLSLPLNKLSNGIYFVRIENQGNIVVKKMNVVN